MPTNTTLGGGGFHHVAINARNFDKSVSFYTDLLGCKPRISWGEPGKRAIMLDTGDGNYIEIFEKPDMAPSTAGTGIGHLCFRSTKIVEITEKCRAAGYKVTMEPKRIDIKTTAHGPGAVPVHISFVEGPDGESIEFFENSLT
jgi:glyoxylase I family protein